MFSLKCIYTGYFISSFNLSAGVGDASAKTTLTCEKEGIIKFKDFQDAEAFCNYLNGNHAAIIPEHFDCESSHVHLEVVNIEEAI